MKRKRNTNTKTIYGISLQDPLSWMESMNSMKWNSFLEKEESAFEDLCKIASQETPISLIQKELESSIAPFQTPLLYSQQTSIQVYQKGSFTYAWKTPAADHWYDASDIYVKDDSIYTIEEIGNGAEIYALRKRSLKTNTIKWEIKGVAPFLSITNTHCYFLLAKNTLVYYKLCCVNLDGKDYKTLYTEEDYRYNLDLHGKYLRRQSGEKQDAFEIHGTNLKTLDGISLESRRFTFDISGKTYTTDPSIESYNSYYNILVKKHKGIRTIYQDGKKLWEGIGQILFDPFSGPWTRIVQPGYPVIWWKIGTPIPSPKPVLYFETEKRKIPTILVKDSSIPTKNLLVIGYGAYGMPTPLNTARWKPLLQRGWAIGIGLWRGGGDHTPYWEDIGRTKGREDVLLDSEEVVRELQKKLSLSPDSTLLYGRSAGGLWAGGLMAKFPDKTLALGSYMEVPYLDVIHTTLNRELPLTNIETDEFGLPEQRISDLRSMIEWSPIDLLKQTRKEKTSFQLLRTSEHDSEVFPYESAKWVSLWNQKNSKRKAWLALDKNQGHFVSGSSALFQQATDISILLFLFRKNRSNRYKMANRKTMNRRNRKNTRKASRKNRKNTRKNRK